MAITASISLIILAAYVGVTAAERGFVPQSPMQWVVVLSLYALLLSVPFVPGVELGLFLLALGGPDGAPLIWGATVAGLVLSFTVGRNLPANWRTRVPALPVRLASGRHLLLAAALNVPGNGLIGGGGGLSLAAGASGSFKPATFCVTVAAATAPIPLLFVLGMLTL